METWLALIGGFALLILGGELLVRGAVQVAGRLGVSPLVIGLTLVGFGTSTPELVTSVQAALSGSPGIAYGNIVGSNIANILLILGGAAILSPIVVSSSGLKRDSAIMICAALLFSAVAMAMPLGRMVGGIFVVCLCAYVYTAFRYERRLRSPDHGAVFEKSQALQETDPALSPRTSKGKSISLSLLIALGGLALVVLGGNFLVEGAIELARSLGLSETVIGLTIVAVGTSMPELVTSVVAALRKQADVAFGNIVGSNIYNILGIGGITALIAPIEVPIQIVTFDNPVMIAASILLFGVAYTGLKISRVEGAVLLSAYLAYLFWMWPKEAS